MIDINDRLELLADDYLVESFSGKAGLRLHRPEPREAALVTNMPWEGCMTDYATVLRDGDKALLYYGSWSFDFARDCPARPPSICLAESKDGIVWERTPVNIFEYQGISRNNIVWRGEEDDDYMGVAGFTPFLDEHSGCLPEQRYKAVGTGWSDPKKGLCLVTSADGIRWSLVPDKKAFIGYALDSQNVVFWDAMRGKYRAFIRTYNNRIRGIATAVSPDLTQWSEPVPLAYPGVPEEQLYTNNIQPYYRAPHIFLGFPTRYIQREWSPSIEALSELEHRRMRSKTNIRYGTALTDALFMSSRDGVNFRRWGEAFIRPGLRSEGNWTYGDNFVALGILETESALPGGGKELSLYSNEYNWRGEGRTLRRYTLRMDGFVSLNATAEGGEMITKPLLFSGRRLALNISTSAAGRVYVELQDVNGHILPGYAMDDCLEIIGDTLDYTVRWKNGADVGCLIGRPVRVRMMLHDADLYSFRFTND